MKKHIIFLSLFFFALSIYAQELSIKFYLDDGSFKSYLISDIDSLSVSKSDSKYVMHIYYQDTNIAYYPNEIIQSVKIEKDTSNELYLNVYIFGYPKPYLVDDIDSIVFKIDKWQPLTIGNQVWMLKNLDLDHYRNGDSIPIWFYYNNDTNLGAIYGKLYNWFAATDPRGLAPSGWHLPSNNEWDELNTFLGGQYEAGGKMKETGTKHWWDPNEGATNESGFSAIPGGWRYDSGAFYNQGIHGYWWTSIERDSYFAFYQLIFNDTKSNIRSFSDKLSCFSVRCIKDEK